MFKPHPNLSDALNYAILDSDIEGGAYVAKLPIGRGLEVQTSNTLYTIRKLLDGSLTIAGHAKYCPQATRCNVHGSTWGGSMIKTGFIGRGMYMEVGIIGSGGKPKVITTSTIREVREVL